ncbi:oxygenase MpaB family protein [Ramlibacter pallidus]|uniref:DUF2236 domain-containing protein n=1 Tax=Ramlibacter pallidus TaxID=2780087 RepID=A0ABR9S2Q5_9BURK|nr:oxygenase MpaB family protein [Ramlibacter pallidus]MBE7367796.1 DUF2236 domain-containing protein [Ramlibacter pallidus]
MREWTAELLDEMRHTGDPLADATLQRAVWGHDVPKINAIFRSFAADDAGIPPDAPPEFLEFVQATRRLPAGVDVARAARGGQVMLEHATLCALALLLKSLPSGYAAPRLSSVLHMSGNLEKRPYRRALGVLQMLVNISQPGAFADGGGAIVTGQKLRLLHAGVRHVVRGRLPDFAPRFGTPISQLDMAFTIMTFSVMVVDGLAALGVRWSEAEAADYFYLWQVYGVLQGIRPEWMPATLEEGRAFCEAYAREFSPAEANPDGVALTRADLDMMTGLIPWPMRLLGLGPAPTVYLLRMLGEEAAARVGVRRTARHVWCEWLALRLPVAWQRLWQNLTPEKEAHDRISRLFFRTLIVGAWGEEVRFSVPEDLEDMRKLA